MSISKQEGNTKDYRKVSKFSNTIAKMMIVKEHVYSNKIKTDSRLFLNYDCAGKQLKFDIPAKYAKKFVELMDEVVNEEIVESENKIKYILNY